MKNKIFLFILITAGFFFAACKKNDAGGPPVISDVRSVDTTKRDSFFTQAVPGTLIVIQGSNLGGLQAVYFNDTAAYFNPSYATSTNIIINIPSTAQTAAANPDVTNLITVVTDHGTATYSFTLYLPPPSISSISFDNTGTLVYITGNNFQGIQKITFPVVGDDTALSYTVNKTFTQITAKIPPATAFKDSLRVYCTFGTGAYAYPPPMNITSVSNENATAGATITVNGTNFIGISKVTFPGNIPGTDIQLISVNQFTVVVPNGISTTDSLRIEGALGTAVSPQLFDSYITHTSPGYLSTFDVQYSSDNTGFVGWTGGYASAESSAANYPKASGGVSVLAQASPMAANSSAGSQGNAGLLQLSDFPWVSDPGASVKDYSMKFEVYVASAWTGGEIWISVGDWYTWTTYTARYAPWTTAQGGRYQPPGWVTVTIPLTQFITGNEFYKSSWTPTGSPANKFTDYPTTGVGFLIVNDQPVDVPANTVNLAIDNVRIVKGL